MDEKLEAIRPEPERPEQPSDAADRSGAGALASQHKEPSVVAAGTEIRARRRQFLVGSIATAGLATITNRSALATTAGQCTVSAVGSMNPSHVITGACGDSPGCWKNHDSLVWNDGATFTVNGVSMAVPYTHDTQINKVFPILAAVPFVVSNGTLWNMINGAASIGVQFKDGSVLVCFDSGFESPGEQLNTAAAILNQYFYGARYYPGNIQTYIGGILSQIQTLALSDNGTNTSSLKTQISTLVSNMCQYLDKLNNQGETCAL